MIVLISIVPPLLVFIVPLVVVIANRKSAAPARLARIMSFIALAFGIAHILLQFYPFEYTGEDGIDYIGDMLVWRMMVDALLYTTLIAAVCFAVAATVFAVKAIKAQDKRHNNALTLVLGWVSVVVIAGLFLASFIMDRSYKKKISVDVEQVTSAVDSDGNPAVIIVLELHNGSKKDITYFTNIYDEVTQDGRELYYTVIPELSGQRDLDLEVVEPGGSIKITQSYELREPGKPIRIMCSTYGRDVVYVDEEFEID